MIKKEISNVVCRGKVDVVIIFNNNSNKGKQVTINTELASMYIKELKKIADMENLNSNEGLDSLENQFLLFNYSV